MAKMNCECMESMELCGVFDTSSGGDAEGNDRAHNVWLCNRCGVAIIERVWKDVGITIVRPDGSCETRAPVSLSIGNKR